MTEQLHFLSIVPFGEGNGNALQCSCLENPMDRGGYSLWGCKESDMIKQLTHTQSVTYRPTTLTSSGCLLAMQNLRPHNEPY